MDTKVQRRRVDRHVEPYRWLPDLGRSVREGMIEGCRPKVKGVLAHDLSMFTDPRGSLAVAQLGSGLPFTPRRFFAVFDVPSREVRGEHAHKELHQLLVCLRGECALLVDDGVTREEIVLNTPSLAIHLMPLVWAAQYRFSRNALLLVLASEKYDPASYICDYDEYIRTVRARDGCNEDRES